MSGAGFTFTSQPVNKELIQDTHIAVLTTQWHEPVTDSLRMACCQYLFDQGMQSAQIYEALVPGAFELPLAAQWYAAQDHIHAVICLGCVIQGETKHFDYICVATALGIKDVSLKYSKPVIFGVLTTNNLEEALARSGGQHGNKGEEAAQAALQMLHLNFSIKSLV